MPLVPANPDRVTAILPHVTRIAPDRYAAVLLGLGVLVAIYAYPSVVRRRTERPE